MLFAQCLTSTHVECYRVRSRRLGCSESSGISRKPHHLRGIFLPGVSLMMLPEYKTMRVDCCKGAPFSLSPVPSALKPWTSSAPASSCSRVLRRSCTPHRRQR